MTGVIDSIFSSPDPPDTPDTAEAIREAARLNRINRVIPGLGRIEFTGPNNTTQVFRPGGVTRQKIARRNNINIGALDRAQGRINTIPLSGFDIGNDTPTGLQQAAVGVALRDAGFDMPRRNLNLDPRVPRGGQPTPLPLGAVNQLNREGELQEEQFDVPEAGGQPGGGLPGFDQSTQAQTAQFERAMGLLRPEFERDEERMRQRLANQGIPIGSEAFEDETSRFERERARAREQAAFQAVQAGNQRQGQLFQQGLAGLGARQGLQQQAFGQRRALNQENLATQQQAFGQAAQNLSQRAALKGQEFGQSTQAAQFATQLQQQRFNQQIQRLNARAFVRNQNFNELAAALQGQPVASQQLLQAGGSPASVNTLGARQLAQNARNTAYQGEVQQQQSKLGGLASLGSAAIMAFGMSCSHSYKTNKRPVEHILPRIEALPVEAWDYKPGHGDEQTHIGPYAEDFQKLFGVGDGKMISMIDAVGVCLLGIQELYARVKAMDEEAQNG